MTFKAPNTVAAFLWFLFCFNNVGLPISVVYFYRYSTYILLCVAHIIFLNISIAVCVYKLIFFIFEMCSHQKPSAYNERWLKGCCNIEDTPFCLCDEPSSRFPLFSLNLGICVCVSQQNVDDFLSIFRTL